VLVATITVLNRTVAFSFPSTSSHHFDNRSVASCFSLLDVCAVACMPFIVCPQIKGYAVVAEIGLKGRLTLWESGSCRKN
jgi:hypothetical protein